MATDVSLQTGEPDNTSEGLSALLEENRRAAGPALGRHLSIGPNTSFIWVTRVIFHGFRTNLFIWSSPLPPTGLSRIMSIHQGNSGTFRTTRHFSRNLIRFGLNASVF